MDKETKFAKKFRYLTDYRYTINDFTIAVITERRYENKILRRLKVKSVDKIAEELNEMEKKRVISGPKYMFETGTIDYRKYFRAKELVEKQC